MKTEVTDSGPDDMVGGVPAVETRVEYSREVFKRK